MFFNNKTKYLGNTFDRKISSNNSQIRKLNYGDDVKETVYNTEYNTGYVYNNCIYWLILDSCLDNLPITFRPDDILTQIVSQLVTYLCYDEIYNATDNIHYLKDLSENSDCLTVINNYVEQVKTADNKTSEILKKIPSFTTTSSIDTICINLIAMSNPRKHLGLLHDHSNACIENSNFKYARSLSVTGTVEDWNKISKFLDDIIVYDRDGNLVNWIDRVKKIIEKFIQILITNPINDTSSDSLFTWWKNMILVDNGTVSGWSVDLFTFCATSNGLRICNYDSNKNPYISENMVPYSTNCVFFTNGDDNFKLFTGSLILDASETNYMHLKPMFVLTKLKQSSQLNCHEHKMINIQLKSACICDVCHLASKTVSYCPECDEYACKKCVENRDWRSLKKCSIQHPYPNCTTFEINSHDATVPNIKYSTDFYEDVQKKFVKLQNTKPYIFPKNNRCEYCNNGFVSTVLKAYNEHHNLYIRPDDIWIAIMSQFCIYVLNNSESMRKVFVNHEGQKKIKSVVTASKHPDGSIDIESTIGDLTNLFLENMKKELKPGVADNMIPSFTTTNDTDILAAIIGFMAIMKKYFVYDGCILKCGIPNVTLYGTVDDWEKLKNMAVDLNKFNDDTDRIKTWLKLVVETIDMMILTAKGDTSKELLLWWNNICNIRYACSNGPFLSGWITSYCMFDDPKGIFKFNNPGANKWPVINMDREGFPTSLMIADVDLQYMNTRTNVKMCAGVVGISQTNHDPYGVAPKVSWFIVETLDVSHDLLLSIKRAQHIIHPDKICFMNTTCSSCNVNKKVYGCPLCYKTVECESCMEKYKQIKIADHDYPLYLKYRIAKCHRCKSDIDVGYSLDSNEELIDNSLKYDNTKIPITYCINCVGCFHWIEPKNSSRGCKNTNRGEKYLYSNGHTCVFDLTHGELKPDCEAVKHDIMKNRVCDLCGQRMTNGYGCKDTIKCGFDICNVCLHELIEIKLLENMTDYENKYSKPFCLHTKDKIYFPEKYKSSEMADNIFKNCYGIKTVASIIYSFDSPFGDSECETLLDDNTLESNYEKNLTKYMKRMSFKTVDYWKIERLKDLLKDYQTLFEMETNGEKLKLFEEIFQGCQEYPNRYGKYLKKYENKTDDDIKQIINVDKMNILGSYLNKHATVKSDMQYVSDLSDDEIKNFIIDRFTYNDLCMIKNIITTHCSLNIDHLASLLYNNVRLASNGYSRNMNLFKSLPSVSDIHYEIFGDFEELDEYVMSCSSCKIQCSNYYTNLDTEPTIYCFKCIRKFIWKDLEFKDTR